MKNQSHRPSQAAGSRRRIGITLVIAMVGLVLAQPAPSRAATKAAPKIFETV